MSDLCGDSAPMAGNSLACKFKHKLMLPFDDNHCFHIGINATDRHGKHKCSDAVECPELGGGPDLGKIFPIPDTYAAAAAKYDEWVVATFPNDDRLFPLATYKFPAFSTKVNDSSGSFRPPEEHSEVADSACTPCVLTFARMLQLFGLVWMLGSTGF